MANIKAIAARIAELSSNSIMAKLLISKREAVHLGSRLYEVYENLMHTGKHSAELSPVARQKISALRAQTTALVKAIEEVEHVLKNQPWFYGDTYIDDPWTGD